MIVTLTRSKRGSRLSSKGAGSEGAVEGGGGGGGKDCQRVNTVERGKWKQCGGLSLSYDDDDGDGRGHSLALLQLV